MHIEDLVKTSKVTLANNVSKSLRATIPNNVVDYSGLKFWRCYRVGNLHA